jgi:hypothetical protein
MSNDEESDMWGAMACFNSIYPADEIYLNYESAKTMKKSVIAGMGGPMTQCEVKKISHPLFDKAYIYNYKEFGDEYIYWEFRGLKKLETPVIYFDFTDSETGLMAGNLENFLVTAEYLEFSATFPRSHTYPSEEHFVMTTDEMIKVAEGIVRKD